MIVLIVAVLLGQPVPWLTRPTAADLVKNAKAVSGDMMPDFERLSKQKAPAAAKWQGLWFDVGKIKVSTGRDRDEKTGEPITIVSFTGPAFILDNDAEGDRRVRHIEAVATVERYRTGKQRFHVEENNAHDNLYPKCLDKECLALDLLSRGTSKMKVGYDIVKLQVFESLGLAFPVEIPVRALRVKSMTVSNGNGALVDDPVGPEHVLVPPNVTTLMLEVAVRLIEKT